MQSSPLGARYSPDGQEATFQVASPQASRIELWLYAAPTGAAPILTVPLSRVRVGLFSGTIPLASLSDALRGGALYYGFRAWGPNWNYDAKWKPGTETGFLTDADDAGNRFNPNKLLLDPYALEISHNPLTPEQPDRSLYFSGPQFRQVDTGPFAPKGIVLPAIRPDFGAKPERPFREEIVYEVHLRGLTKNDLSLPEPLRGTYAGAALRAPYLRDLGITAVEFLPIHETQNSLNDLPQYAALQNYWGYNSIGFLAPSRRYSSDRSPGGPTREWIAMVKAFHAAGLKVFVDVVYNHHDEGEVDAGTATTGAIYSLRGLANLDYLEPRGNPARPNTYQDNNGVGPNINAASPLARNLVLDSLKYMTNVLGVDGYRFDLAAILGNGERYGGFTFAPSDPEGILQRALHELPARPDDGGPGVDLIAEPYTADGAGQNQGQFPKGWSEWNDHYRDLFRKSQNKLGVWPATTAEMANRFSGSVDLFGAQERKPWNSVNYIVCHDGFTLHDLHSFATKHNTQPYPFGPSPGGRDTESECCWNHDGDFAAQDQAIRTSLALLMVSAGVPMITGGSEMNRTQYGNNNAYNLDTAANWLDWSADLRKTRMTEFTRLLLNFRRAHPAFRPANFFTGLDGNGNGVSDLTWLRDNGAVADWNYLGDPGHHFLAFRLDGSEFGDEAATLYVAYNAWSEPVQATLPAPLHGPWLEAVNTGADASAWNHIRPPGAEPRVSGNQYEVPARSVVVLLERSSG